jgi:AcrR family transcriptional regulator
MTMDDAVAVRAAETPAGPERGAGQDPRKRTQILDGARTAFLERGFDASSMGDIARIAGVSKGTLYVYFDSKEDLFAELVRIEKTRQADSNFNLSPDDRDVEAVLKQLGRGFMTFLTAPHIIKGTRIIVAIGDRMPALGEEFYDAGPKQCISKLAAYLDAQVAAGGLAIDDTELAAGQFLDMCQSTVMRALLFGAASAPPSPARISTVVDSAVRVFMAAYAAKPAG